MRNGVRERRKNIVLYLVQRQGMAREKTREDKEKARQKKNARQGDRRHSKAWRERVKGE